jgi:hypothetical protein
LTLILKAELKLKKVKIRTFNYKTCYDNNDYRIAIAAPEAWHFEVTSGPITYYNGQKHKLSGYKTKAAAISAAKSYRVNLKLLKAI